MSTTFRRYTKAGCYPLAYLTSYDHSKAAVMCAGCATDEECTDEVGEARSFVNWENTSLHCEECGARIETAYAEDEV